MPEAELQRISDSANMIVAGFSYTKMDNNRLIFQVLTFRRQAALPHVLSGCGLDSLP